MIKFDNTIKQYVGYKGGAIVAKSKYEGVVKRKMMEHSENAVLPDLMGEDTPIKAANDRMTKFSINKRFEFVANLVKMVATGVQPSAVITGEGGLGKTYTVTKTLKENGYVDISDLSKFEEGERIPTSNAFLMVKGNSTAKGLYRVLFENRNSIIVFDDCDSVFHDKTSVNLLKAALDSYGERIISWAADLKDPDLPRSFKFEGRVIFISNLGHHKIDQAIRSRSLMVDLEMTNEQKIERMEFIAMQPEFLPEYNKTIKRDALNLIRELKDIANEISLRTLISVAKVRASNEDWRDMAEYVLTH